MEKERKESKMELNMPKFGAAMESGVITQWLKKEGETFRDGDEICEIETDKISNFLAARYDGTLDKILVPSGEEAKVGAPIALVTKTS
jgi:pyruvate dehydrogenase E2 component (dihydrolipoamide acetyltransferase)